jgi:hypothetical protein
MKKLVWLFVLFLVVFPLCSHATKMTDFTEDTSPTSDDIFWTTNDPSGSPADRKVSLGNLLLFFATQDVTWTGTWTGDIVGNADTATALASNPSDCAANQFATTIAANGNLTCAALTDADVPNDITVTTLTLADDSTITPPAALPASVSQIPIFTTEGVGSWLSLDASQFMATNASNIPETITISEAYAMLQPLIFDADADGNQDTVTDEQLICGNVSGAVYGLKSCGAKVTDNSTASHATYKDSSGYIANQVLTIDAHAASTTITLIPGICPIIHNASQADADINNTLPAVGAGLCFVALATSAEADKYWRLTAAAANTVCLNRTCGKDYIQFPTPAVGDTFTCMSDGTNWYCYDRDSDAEAGDL